MAKNRTIDDILRELKKDYQSVLLRAVQQATDTAAEDIYKFSMSVLERYYENYMPSSYDRTDSLQMATVPIAEIKNHGDTIVATYGVKYDSDILESFAAPSYYDASNKYGNVDGDWVIQNYLMGIHPATNGSSDPDTVVYVPWQDSTTPNDLLQKYLTWYKNKFNDNVNDYIISHMMR